MHILLAEDNAVNQRLFQRHLSRIGSCTLAIVGDGQQALNYLAGPPATCPRPDIIFMDVSMPVMSGLEATQIIRTQQPFISDPRTPSTPIIAIAANILRRQMERYAQQGFDDVFAKPFRLSLLKEVIMFWSRRRVRPMTGGQLAVPLTGGPNLVVAPPVQWGPFPLRAFRGPRSLL
ncbi:CheY-like superfamily [Aspergillus californicus]